MNLNQFYTCRTLRKDIIDNKYIHYEKQVESAEGPATYCEYSYMKAFASSAEEQEYIHHRFFYSLIEPTYGRKGLRNKHLLTGMIQCLLLSERFEGWQADYYASGLTLNDYFFSRFKPSLVNLPDLSFYEARSKYFTAIEKKKHQEHLEAFMNQSGIKVTLLFETSPEFRSFDPMHAESINDSLVLHSTLLKLGKGNNYFSLVNHQALSEITGQVWFVRSITFFVPSTSLRLEHSMFVYNSENINVHWQYSKQVKKGNEYIITVE